MYDRHLLVVWIPSATDRVTWRPVLSFRCMCCRSVKRNIGSIPPTQIAAGGVAKVGSLVKQFGKSAFLVTDKGLTAIGLTGKVTALFEAASVPFVVFDEIMPNPTAEIVNLGAKRLREAGPDAVVVTLGGGSSMDAGKAIATLAKQDGFDDILSFCFAPDMDEKTKGIDMATLMPKQFSSGAHAIIAVPTTSGTASETNGASVITDTSGGGNRKLIFLADAAKASTIILDAELCVGVPAYPTATCGMDVLTHALEAFTSVHQNPYGDAVALGAIKLVAQNLRKVMADPKDLEGRQNMHIASHMAGVAFNISPLGIVHAMGHPLSAVYHQAHGQTLSTLLPVLMKFNAPVRADKYAEVARAFGVHVAGETDEQNAQHAIAAVTQLSKDVGTARSIKSYSNGSFEADLPELVRQAVVDISMITTARKPTYEEVFALYREAYDNDELYPPAAPASKL
jgi:alcohol dehydrogenase